MPSGTVIHAEVTFQLLCRDALLRFTYERNSQKPFGEGQVRVIEDRAAGSAELLPTGQALINPGALVIALRFAGNLGDAPDLATVNATHLAIGPAHFFDVVEALVVGLELLVNVYELHNARILAKGGFCVKCIIALQLLHFGHLRKTGGGGVTGWYTPRRSSSKPLISQPPFP